MTAETTAWSLKSIFSQIWRTALAIALSLLATVIMAGLLATGMHVVGYGRFSSDQHSIFVAVADAPLLKYGTIMVEDRADTVNIVLEEDEWTRAATLWKAASAEHGSHFRKVGQIRESDTVNPTTLTFLGGPSVRVQLEQNGVCVFYDVTASEVRPFSKALDAVALHLAGKPGHPLFVSDRRGLFDAFENMTGAFTPNHPQSAVREACS